MLEDKDLFIQGGPKKTRTRNFLQNFENIGQINLKINMHNLNTHHFQHTKHEFPNSKIS